MRPNYYFEIDCGSGWPSFSISRDDGSMIHNCKVYIEDSKVEEWIKWANTMGNGIYSWNDAPIPFEAFRVVCSLEVINLLEELAIKACYSPQSSHPPKNEALSFGINSDKLYSWGRNSNWGSSLKQLTISEAIQMLSSAKTFEIEFTRSERIQANSREEAHQKALKLMKINERMRIL